MSDTDTVEVAYHLTARAAASCLAAKRKLSAPDTHNLAELIEAKVGRDPVALSEIKDAIASVTDKASAYEVTLLKAASARVVVA